MSDQAPPQSPPRRGAEAGLADKYDQMMGLAYLFDSAGGELAARARLGAEIIGDPGIADSAELSSATHTQAEDDVRAASTGKHGLLHRAVELEADALVLRATVLTYRWIDDLQAAAHRTLGSIAARAIGYLAPEVALGGAIVSAGLIETDALDRADVAGYLNELAENNPELMEHVTSGGGGLLDGLQMRSLLTTGVRSGESGRLAGRGGLRGTGIEEFPVDESCALRDLAGAGAEAGAGAGETAEAVVPVGTTATTETGPRAPRTLADLMAALQDAPQDITVHQVAPGRYIAYLTGAEISQGPRLRLVGSDHSAYADRVVRAIESAVEGDPDARVMLVGSARGGLTAAEVAAGLIPAGFVIDQVVTAGCPAAQVPRIPRTTRMLALEDRTDPVALLGSLVNAGSSNRLTVVFDAHDSPGQSAGVAGGRAADAATHPELVAEIARIHELGYLAG